MKTSQMVLIVGGLFSIASSASAATWKKSDPGTYDWADTANWTDGTPPTATADALLNVEAYRPTGNQTIAGDGVARQLDLHNRNFNTSRTFTGNIAASNLYLRVGTMNVEGCLSLVGTDGTCSIVGATLNDNQSPSGVLDIKSGGVLRADGVHALCVGRRADGGDTKAGGRVILRDGGTLILNPSSSTGGWGGILLGRSQDGDNAAIYPASYIQEGGSAMIGRFIAGFEKGAYGVMSVHGGVIDLPYISNDTRFRIGHGGYGIFEQFGGDIYVSTNISASSYSISGDSPYRPRNYDFDVGSGRSANNGLKGAYFYARGGSFSTRAAFNIQGGSFNLTGVNPSHATIADEAVVTARIVRVGANTGDGKASLNIIGGGTLATAALNSVAGREGRSEVNANGGRIVFTPDAIQEQGLFLDAINIYEGGLEIRNDRTDRIFIGNAGTNVLLRTPGGCGVAIGSVADIGFCSCPPWIEISGGSGSNALAIALASHDQDSGASGTMTNAVLACQGEGYVAGDVVTATVYRPWGTSSATRTYTDKVTLSLVENKPGALVKTGAYPVYLYAQPEFAGSYEVRQGWLVQSSSAGVASPNVRAVVVGGSSDAMFQAGSGSAAAVEANWNPINPAATLTLGALHGPGRLTIPEGADGKPFEQTFSSLSVSGTGNAIGIANGGASNTAGFKLTFGTIVCNSGSMLTIPNPKANPKYKVYCTGMPVGTRFKNIKLAGTDYSAMIGDDGQLVKATLGMTLIFR